MNNHTILEMRSITKEFPGVKALSEVSLRVEAGEIHAICGENGAGKSTLMKVLSGLYPYGDYSGEIVFQGEEVRFKDIRSSEAAGIVIIHQELALIPELSIAENIFLGNEPTRFGVIDWDYVNKTTLELMARVGLSEEPLTKVKDIGVGKQQLVEIAKALNKSVKLLILDEPTAALNEADSQHLLDLMAGLRSKGISCIMISHKLNEIEQIADSITIIRDGKSIETLHVKNDGVDEDRIIRGMVGRSLESRFPDHTPSIGETFFEVRDWTVAHPSVPDRLVCKGSNFHVKRGEIVGFAGLMGAGRTELARSVFGRSYGNFVSGQILINGKEVTLRSVPQAISAGLAYVTEDRKHLGLILGEDIRKNVTLANLGGVSSRAVIDDMRELAVADDYRGRMRIRCSSVYQESGNLSGGNQQKVVLSKWLFSDPEVLILDEPTRGIDVGAKYEIYQIIDALADSGKAVVFISSEMPELLGMCDRICVMNEGRFVAEMPGAEASQEAIMRAIMRPVPVRQEV